MMHGNSNIKKIDICTFFKTTAEKIALLLKISQE